MRKQIYLFLILSLIIGEVSLAQTSYNKIEKIEGFWGKYKLNGKVLTPNKLFKTLEINHDNYFEIQKSKNNLITYSLLGYTGCLLIGWHIVNVAANHATVNMTIIGAGAGIILIGIPFAIAYSDHLNNAVNIYNKGSDISGNSSTNIRIGLTNNGLGVKINF